MMCQGDAQCSSNPKRPNQQQPPAEPDWTPWPCPTCTVGLLLAVVVPILSLICLAMVRKACSTLEAFFADVSRKGIPRLSANSCIECQPCACNYRIITPEATGYRGQLTFATVYSTTFLSDISLLFPTSSLFTPSVAYLSISCSHCLTLLKESMSVTS